MSRASERSRKEASGRFALRSFFLAALALNLWIFRYFLVTGATAACIAILLDPPYQRLKKLLRDRPSLASAIVVVVVLLVVLGPLATYGVLLARQAVSLYDYLRPHLEPQALSELWSTTLPERFGLVRRLQEFLGIQELGGALERVAPALANLASGANQLLQTAVTGLTSAIVYLLLFPLLLFFLLRDGRQLALTLHELLPFSEAQRSEMFDRVARTVKGVLYSMVVVPIVQGLLAMLGYWLTGLPRPVLFGFLTMASAVVPGVGAPAVWLPASIYLFVSSSWYQGLGLLLYGTLIVGTADNIIKPVLLHGTARIHTLFAFLSILGGVLTFGAPGLLLGPVVFSLLLSMVGIQSEMRHDDSAPAGVPSSDQSSSSPSSVLW